MKKAIESAARTTTGGTIPCQDATTFGDMAYALAISPLNVLGNVLGNILLWLERGRQRRHLYGLSNHLLKDIGLSRVDVDFEYRKLPWRE
jgi:uncharacterized protein YjiS (DUF1127 family)